ncbi:MAG: FAD-dependent oxidoreductase, partial [Symploca sp. SIO2E6]|nr:FAD-dependent oxidoreductase [Symploca sp. SIO2E6]
MNLNSKLLLFFLIGLIGLMIGSTTDYFSKVFSYLISSEQNQAKSNTNNQPPAPFITQNFDVVVYGDELQGICAAIWAKKTLGDEGKVALVRSNPADELLGGLLTRGGLAF